MPHARLQHGATLYLACSPSTLIVVALEPAPAVTARRTLEGEIERFFEADGGVWVVLKRLEARPLSALAPRRSDEPPPPVAQRPPTPPARAPSASVLERRPGSVIVGTSGPGWAKVGGHVELFVTREVDLGGGQLATRVETVAVGRVSVLAEDRAEVALGLNERVPDGAQARPTEDDRTASRIAPPRPASIWDLGLTVRPFLALGALGVGTINDLTVAHRFEAPVSIQALLEPAGFGFADAGDVIALAGNVVAAYDTRFFEIGLGLGWSAVNSDVEGSNDAGAEAGSGGFERVRSGLSIAQIARLGARDGLHLSVHNAFILHKDAFRYGGTTGAVQIPIGGRLWLLARGGGGLAGFAFGELGLRVLLKGNGYEGTVFLVPTLGGGGLFGEKEVSCGDSKCVQSIDYSGPMVGLGVEWRL